PHHHGAAADILEKPCPRGDRNDEQREQPPSTANHRNTSDSTSGQETPLAIALLDRTVHAIGRDIPRAQLQRALWTHDLAPPATGRPQGPSGDFSAVPRCEATTATISSAPRVASASTGRLSLSPQSSSHSPRTRIGRP